MGDQPSIAMQAELGRYTLEKIKPHLRPILDNNILKIAIRSADEVGEDREAIIQATLARFSKWITMPIDGRSYDMTVATPSAVLEQIPLKERRHQVLLHQSFRFTAMLNELEMIDNGAIAIIWHTGRCEVSDSGSHHLERDGNCYALRDNWALNKGLMTVGPVGFYGDGGKVTDAHCCRCSAQGIFHLGRLPPSMLTDEGNEALARARALINKV